MVSGLKNAGDMNLIIQQQVARVNDILVRYRLMNKIINKDQLKLEYSNPGIYSDFNEYAKNYIDARKGIISPATEKANRSCLKKLRRFRDPLPFKDIGEDLINNYKKWLKGKDNKNNENTISKSMIFIKAVLSRAIRDKIIEETPFHHIRIRKPKTDIIYLKRAELLKVINSYKKRYHPGNYHLLLRYYLFSCVTGLRLSDVKRITMNDIVGDTLVIRPQKTSGTTNELVQIPLIDFAQDLILDADADQGRPIFFTFADQVTNRYLKEVMKSLEIKKTITFHSARHTFATMFLETNPGDVATLQRLLGHADIQHTMVYVHIDEKVKRERMEALSH
jgi:integrase